MYNDMPTVPVPPPPPRPSFAARLACLPLAGKLSLGCLALIVIILCGAFSVGAIGGLLAASPTPTASALVQATATPTPRPTATSTPAGPRPIREATFGGLKDAFQAKFGDPIFSNNGVLFQFRFTATDGKPAVVAIQLRTEETRDGKDHVITLTLNPLANSGNSWNEATAEATAQQFLPKDATFTQDKQVTGLGLYHLYLSPDLAVTFKDDAFSDSTGKLVPPGTFWLTCGTSAAGGCTFQLGDV